jgi:transcription-repair coupling factor (superfamily II helicase)
MVVGQCVEKKAVTSLKSSLKTQEILRIEGPSPTQLGYMVASEEFDGCTLWVVESEREQLALAQDLTTFTGGRVAVFPDMPHLPWDGAGADPILMGERLALRAALLEGEASQNIVVTARSLLSKWVTETDFRDGYYTLEVGQTAERSSIIDALMLCGYQRVDTVEDSGTFAVRGGIIDCFIPLHIHPVRIDLFGDEIDTIHPYHVETQRRGKELGKLNIFPIREVAYTDSRVARAVKSLRDMGEKIAIPSRRLGGMVEDIERRHYFFGIESLWPLFYESTQSVAELLVNQSAQVVLVGDHTLFESMADQAERSQVGYDAAIVSGEPAVGVEHFYESPAAISELLETRPQIRSSNLFTEDEADFTSPMKPWTELVSEMNLRRSDPGRGEILDPLVQTLRARFDTSSHVLLLCEGYVQAERLRDLLLARKMDLPILKSLPRDVVRGLETPRIYRGIVIGALSEGFESEKDKLCIITDREIFDVSRLLARTRRRKRPEPGGLETIRDLKEGDAVIHMDHGIGRYRGLTRLMLSGLDGDYVHLEYADGDKLYVPIYRLNLIQEYRGPQGNVRLDKLGGTRWAKTRKKVKDAMVQMAHRLLEVQARRAALSGFSMDPPDHNFRAFEARFAYEETPDQRTAIEAVIDDLQDTKPMDRVVCGDVGFGKTEVAIRASLLAVLGGYQVAVLVPTTVLAEQHGATFRERLEPEGVRVEVLNRFRKPAEIRAIVQQVREGKIDVLIGTHRVLSQDIVFNQLGLLVVDEEHRFGVRHKERVKELKHEVNVLTLTATPIPRTLHMATAGMRDLSTIKTPPAARSEIRTEVLRFDEEVIREAIVRELHRGGQVFFVHNRVASIHSMAQNVREWVPDAKLGVAHGQMKGPELEKIMVDFVTRKTDILVSTAIIESGIDIPSANTMIINRADTFGLSQLHQIRGRIGRGKRRAYAYLMIPRDQRMTRDATERLAALKRHSSLGAGYQIATRDLELRGAGDLLGSSQSGHIAAVGFELYTRLLEEAVQQVRGSETTHEVEPDIKLPVTAVIPESYVEQPMHRLDLYQRLSQTSSDEQIFEVYEQMQEYHGQAPEEVAFLVEVMLIRLRLKRLGISALSSRFDPGEIKIGLTLLKEAHIDSARFALMLQNEPGKYGLTPSGRLSLTFDVPQHAGLRERLRNVRDALSALPLLPE